MTLTALKVEGPFMGTSGHDHHTREFVRALRRLGVEIELHNLWIWGSAVPGEPVDPWFDALARPVDAAVYLRFGMPHQVLVDPAYANVNYTMFEASRIHASWVAQAEAFDRVIVPNEICREAWIASGAPPDQVRVCPLGIDAELYGRTAEPLSLPGTDARVRFLNLSEDNRRKNLASLARVWKRATRPDDDAALILKLNGEDEALARCRAWFSGAAPVVIFNRRLTDDEMPGLYAAATHYVSLSHGEAWDLPMTEAAASGLELVAPWHSAYRTYLDPGCAHLVESHAVPVELPPDDPNYVLFGGTGAEWWEPDEEQAVEIIRSIVDGTAPPKPPPRERVLSELGWDKAGQRLFELLSEVEPRKGRRRRWQRRASAPR